MGEAINCVFRVDKNKCGILTKKKCSGCSFKMTPSEQVEKKAQAEQRLSERLTAQQRRDIKAKYKERGEGEKDGFSEIFSDTEITAADIDAGIVGALSCGVQGKERQDA